MQCHALAGVLGSGKYGLQIDLLQIDLLQIDLGEKYVESLDCDYHMLFKSQAVKDGLRSSPSCKGWVAEQSKL
jgi:hypothetical protein